jgi:hypothetical protein
MASAGAPDHFKNDVRNLFKTDLRNLALGFRLGSARSRLSACEILAKPAPKAASPIAIAPDPGLK